MRGFAGAHEADNESTATSNDPWGPTGTDMADIAKITYNRYGIHLSRKQIYG